MDKKDKLEYVKPYGSGKSHHELFGEYHGLHVVNSKTGVNKPRARLTKIKGFRDDLEDLVKRFSPEEGGSLSEAHSDKEAEEKAAFIITKLVHEGVKADNAKAAMPKTEEEVERYLASAGIQGGYKAFIQEVMGANLSEYDTMPTNLKQLLDYVSRSKHADGRKINSLQRVLTSNEHINETRKRVSDITGVELSEVAGPSEILQTYNTYVETLARDYEAKAKKPYTKSSGKPIAEFHQPKDEKYHKKNAA
ncbi:hypothetical protein HYV84_02285 [Candidatus Woesearchaeota archaeon]|nr:hypothetical protein [Candidatus Woesearchaeota archaeon]